MRRISLLLLFSAFVHGQVPELRPAAILALGDRVLEGSATLLLAPDRATVLALCEDRLQLWDGRSGAVLKSSLPTRQPGEQDPVYLGCGGGTSGPTFSAPPPPLWDEATGRYHLLDWNGIREVGIADGLLHRSELPGADALGRGCRLSRDESDRLRLLFSDGQEWRMTPRRPRNTPSASIPGMQRFLDASSAYSRVALAPDGSRVAAYWSEWEGGGSEGSPNRLGPSHLLAWRRGDRFPYLDLQWEGEDPLTLDFTPSGKGILARLSNETLLLDPDTGRETAVIPAKESPSCWMPGRDKALFLLDSASRTYAVWDLEWGEELRRFRLPALAELPGESPQAHLADDDTAGGLPALGDPAAISPDGRWIACLRRCPPDWDAAQVVLFELES